MVVTSSIYFSVKLTRFLMKAIGFWSIRTREEQLSLRLNYAKMFTAIGICFSLALSDLYYCQHNFYDATYFACCTIPPFVTIIKAISFTFRRKELLWLIEQSQNHFWYKEYDAFEKKVMDSLDKKASLLMCLYIVLNCGVAIIYVLIAAIESIANPGERVHPFTWRFFNLPSTRTPYYEILFMVETIIIMHAATYYCCFDNTLYMLCMLVSEQFKILQNKFRTIFDPVGEESVRSYRMFKSCIVYHHLLLSYVQKLECVFSFPLMSQLLISSIVLCVSGFQLTMDYGTFVKKFMFLTYVLGALMQIFLITLNCNNITEQSDAVGKAIYSCNWEGISCREFHRLRKDMIIVMLRTRRPCHLTAAKFFPISIESFTKVLSTTVSYLTLLRTMDVNEQHIDTMN